MTINKEHLVALRASVTLTYISVMIPGLYNTCPGPPDIAITHWMVSWAIFNGNIDISFFVSSYTFAGPQSSFLELLTHSLGNIPFLGFF